MCTKRFEKHSCGCPGQELPPVLCSHFIAAARHTSSGAFVYGMYDYVRRLADLREQCLQATQRVDVGVDYKCRQCLYDDLVTAMAGNVGGGGKGVW